MRTFSLLRILKSDYFKISIILSIWYIFSHTSYPIVSHVSFVIILFLIYARNINNDNLIWYSLVFGLFYDYTIGSALGVSVLIFVGLSIVKVMLNEFFDWSLWQTRITGSFMFILAFHVYTIFYFGYDFVESYYYMWSDVFIDFSVYLVISIIMEMYSAFSKVKR